MKPFPQMNDKELLSALKDRPNLFTAEEILKEAYKKNYYMVLEFASKNAFLVETLGLSSIILDYILLKQNGVGKNLLSILLNHDPRIIGTYSSPKLTDICLRGNTFPAVALLSKNTPHNIVSQIVKDGALYNSGMSPFYTTNEQMASQVTSQSPILTEMIKLLQQGWKWENETSATVLSARIAQTPGDKFITIALSCNLSVTIASTFISSIDEDKIQNNQAFKNLILNEHEEVKIAVLIDKFKSTGNNEQLLIALIDHISKGINAQELMWLWQYTLDKMSKDPDFNLDLLFYYENGGHNLMHLFAENNVSIATAIIRLLIPWISKASHLDAPPIEELIDLGLNTPSLQELTLTIPKEVFDRISLTPQHRQLVEDRYASKEPEDEYLKQMKNLFANKKPNWYQKHSEATSIIIQEAGWKENIVTSLIASLVLILGGSTVKNASDKTKVKEEQIMAAINDPYLMERAKQIARTEQPQMTEPFKRSMPVEKVNDGVDSFTKEAFDYIGKHEGLRLKPYFDTENNMTIGIGHKILPNEDFSKGISKEEALSLFQKDIHTHLDRAKRLFPSFDNYPNKVKAALLDGVFRGDHKVDYKTTHLINNNHWIPASQEYLVNNDYNKSKAEGTGVHMRMEDNAKIMKQYGEDLQNSQYAKR